MRRQGVVIKVSNSFYNNFEAQRRAAQEKLGVRNLTQIDFTEMMARKIPIIKQDLLRRNKR